MKLHPILIGLLLLGSVSLFLWATFTAGLMDPTLEYNATLRKCSGDRFSFIQGTYLYPITETEIMAEKAALLSRVKDNPVFRAGGSGDGGGGGQEGPDVLDPRTVAWGYCINDNNVPAEFNYVMGRDAPSNNAIRYSDEWYQEKIVNQSLDKNVACESCTVVERFRRTGLFHQDLVRDDGPE
jgi:hypothetical protein